MNNHDYSKHLANAARVAVALCALAALGGRAAQAQTTVVTDPSQLGAFTFVTTPYPGVSGSQIPSPQTLPTVSTANNVTPGPTTVTLTDTMGAVFSRLDAQTGSGVNFPAGTTLLQTADASNNSLGPLRIDFNTVTPGVGVAGFGLSVQDFAFDTETFTLQVFTNGSTVVNPANTFTFTADNSNPATNGHAIFLGALGNTGSLITSATISSVSTVGGQVLKFSNNFFVSPVLVTNVPPAVPEASTVVSFGMGVLLFAGMALGARRRKVSRAPQSAG